MEIKNMTVVRTLGMKRIVLVSQASGHDWFLERIGIMNAIEPLQFYCKPSAVAAMLKTVENVHQNPKSSQDPSRGIDPSLTASPTFRCTLCGWYPSYHTAVSVIDHWFFFFRFEKRRCAENGCVAPSSADSLLCWRDSPQWELVENA